MIFIMVVLFLVIVGVFTFLCISENDYHQLYGYQYDKIYREVKHVLFIGDAKRWELEDVFEKCKLIEENVAYLSITKEINISELVLLLVVYTINNSHLRKIPIKHKLLFIKLKYIKSYSSLYLRNMHEKF